MGAYLLTLLERSGEDEHITKHVIQSTDKQMVKYYYHKSLKDRGWTQGDRKHRIKRWGGWAEIEKIETLDWEEYQVLDEYLPSWPKL